MPQFTDRFDRDRFTVVCRHLPELVEAVRAGHVTRAVLCVDRLHLDLRQVDLDEQDSLDGVAN